MKSQSEPLPEWLEKRLAADITPDEVDAVKKASAAPILEPTPNQSRKEVPKMGKKQAEKELRKALGLG